MVCYIRKYQGLLCYTGISNRLFKNARHFVSQAQPKEIEQNNVAAKEWSRAKPYSAIPGPSKFELICKFMPGGRLYKKSVNEVNLVWREEYGDIVLLPGLFGKKDILITFNPEDYETVFRTEGKWPMRPGIDILKYYRTELRPEVFQNAAGLVAEQGERWAKFRSVTNPVMMNLKTVGSYVPKIDAITQKFVDRIKSIRDPQSMEVPEDFEKDINHWTLDAVGLIAFDNNLDMINNCAQNPELRNLADGNREFFELMMKLDLQPSLWKYIATPDFKRCISILDRMTDISTYYIDQAVVRLQHENATRQTEKPTADKSILERLLDVDRRTAIVTALDIFLAGVDPTTSATAACLLCLAKNPEKQQKLREEIMKILPTKESVLVSDKMKHLPYLRACIKEALRSYPVIPANMRATGQDVVLSNYCVPKGIGVLMPLQILFDDEKYFERPKEYLPERWLRSEQNEQTNSATNSSLPFVFLPFGFGPRTCVGKRIVDIQLEIILAKLVRNFEIRFDHSTENVFRTTVINVPDKPLCFKFTDITT